MIIIAINVGTAVGYLMLDTTKFTDALKSANDQLKGVGNSVTPLSSKFKAVGQSLTTVGSNLTKSLTVPIVSAGVAFVNMAADFEQGMSKVQALLGITDSESEVMVQLGEKAREMGAKTIFSATESANAFQFMAQAGWSAEQMMSGIEATMLLAAGQGLELEHATSIVTDSLTAFGLSAEDTSHYVDVLTVAANVSNTDISMLGETFKYVAPIAGALGFSVEDVAIASGLMANQGIKASQAGTTLRSAFTNMLNPTDTMAAAMEALGISMTESDGSMKSLDVIIQQLRTSFSTLTEAEQAQYAAQIFGKTAMTGMLAVINASPESYNMMTESINNSTGAAQSFHDTMMNNFSGDFELLKGSLEELGLSLGEILLPVARDLVNWLNDMIDKFNALDEGTKQTIITIAGIVAAVGPVLLILGQLSSGVSAVLTVVKTVAGIFTGAGAGISAIMGPIGIVVAGVAAFAAAWSTNFAGIRDTVSSIFGSVKEIITTIWNAIKSVWDNNLLGIRTIVETVWNAIEGIFRTVFGNIEAAFKTFSALIKGDWEGVWNGIKDFVSNTLNGILNVIKGIGTGLFNAGKAIFTSLWDGIKSVWNSITTWVSDGVTWLLDTINPLNWFGGNKKANTPSSHAAGLDYVPYDNYTAVLHRGERVMTAEENEAFNSGQINNNGGNTYNFYSPKAINPVEAKRLFDSQQRQLALGFNIN